MATSPFLHIGFLGHLIPACYFTAFGTFALLVSLQRSRHLPVGRSYCEMHVPEKNKQLIQWIAWIVIILLVFVMIPLEGHVGCGREHWFQFFDACFYHNTHAMHEVAYLGFVAVGIVMILEARERLPPDSSRACFALTNLLSFILWNGHAAMKRAETNARIHELLALLSLVHATVTLYSVLRPTNLIAYLAVWGIFVMRGAWLLTAAVNLGIQTVKMSMIDPLFCFEAILVTLLLVVIGACFGKPKEGNNNTVSDRSGSTISDEYEHLQPKDEEGDEEEQLGIT